jgi:hypothetical protein
VKQSHDKFHIIVILDNEESPLNMALLAFVQNISKSRIGAIGRTRINDERPRMQFRIDRIFWLKFSCHNRPLKFLQTLTDFRPSIYMSALLRL